MKKQEKTANKYYSDYKDGRPSQEGGRFYYIEYEPTTEESRRVYQDPLFNSEWEYDGFADCIGDGHATEVTLPKDWKDYHDPKAKWPLEFESDMGYTAKVTNKFVQIGCQRFDAAKFLELKKNLDLFRKISTEIKLNDEYAATFGSDGRIIINDGNDGEVPCGEVDSIAELIEKYAKTATKKAAAKKAVAKKAPAKKAVAKKAPAKKAPAKKVAAKGRK